MDSSPDRNLLQRIKEREDRLANRYVPPPQLEPAWLRRMRDGKLPPKDMTRSDVAA